MKQEQYEKHVETIPMGTPNWKDVEAMILSPTFIQIYQMVVMASEGRVLKLASIDLSQPIGQHAASKTQGVAMGMRLALDQFITLSEEKPDERKD